MIRRIVAVVAVGLGLVATTGWVITAPEDLETSAVPAGHVPDLANGERLFHAASCGTCHATPTPVGSPAPATEPAVPLLGGGRTLETPFGTFRMPNISPDPSTGIGAWSEYDFINAMLHGVSPSGEHYYPAFPYGSFVRMRTGDVLDLYAYLMTLPPVRNAVAGHELAFPYSVRRGVGLWKRLYLDAAPVAELSEDNDATALGRYLVEGPGHCGECHTNRTMLGGLERTSWLAGAPNPEGPGVVPNITPHEEGIGSWSAADIAYYLETGFKPDYDTVGGPMVAVQENLALLRPADREAIAAYLKAIAPKPDAFVARKRERPGD